MYVGVFQYKLMSFRCMHVFHTATHTFCNVISICMTNISQCCLYVCLLFPPFKCNCIYMQFYKPMFLYICAKYYHTLTHNVCIFFYPNADTRSFCMYLYMVTKNKYFKFLNSYKKYRYLSKWFHS